MSQFVVDASVAIKWFVPEVASAEALYYLDDAFTLLVPDPFWADTGNILWKKHRLGELTTDTVRSIFSELQQCPINTTLSSELAEAALEIAIQLDRTVYDSLYLTLAVASEALFVTADQRLFNAISSSTFGEQVICL